MKTYIYYYRIIVISKIHFNPFFFLFYGCFIQVYQMFRRTAGTQQMSFHTTSVTFIDLHSSLQVYSVNLCFYILSPQCCSTSGGNEHFFCKNYEYVPIDLYIYIYIYIYFYHVHVHDHGFLYYHEMRFHLLQEMVQNLLDEISDFH